MTFKKYFFRVDIANLASSLCKDPACSRRDFALYQAHITTLRGLEIVSLHASQLCTHAPFHPESKY